MSQPSTSSGGRAGRSARRAAERAAPGAPTPGRRSPVLLLSIGVLAVAGVLLGAFAVVGALGGGGGSAPIASPRIGLPDGLAEGRTLGAADAPLTVDLWADFQCPVCLRFTDTIEPLLRAAYIQTGAVRIVFHDLAFIGEESIDAAAAARISDAIGPGFWPMHDLLYANQGAENGGSFDRQRLAAMAVRLGMDRGAFLAAMDDPAYRDAVKAETAEGAALGVSSTPTLGIGGTIYPGIPTWEQLSTLLDEQLAAHRADASPAADSSPPADASPTAVPIPGPTTEPIPGPTGVPASPVAAAPFLDGLVTGDSQPFELASLSGHPTFVFFGYTHCPDVCPATIGELTQVFAAEPDARAVFVSIDPERDTPSFISDWAAYLPSQMVPVTGTPLGVRAVADAWGARYAKVQTTSANGYAMSHTADLFLLDRSGDLVTTYPFGTPAARLIHDLAALPA